MIKRFSHQKKSIERYGRMQLQPAYRFKATYKQRGVSCQSAVRAWIKRASNEHIRDLMFFKRLYLDHEEPVIK